MHVPNPLGTYPLVLRDYDVANPRDGELLLDYENYDLYYINRSDHQRVSVAKDIYKRILDAKVQNAKFKTYDYDKNPEAAPVIGTTMTMNATISGTKATFKDRSVVNEPTLIVDYSSYIFPPVHERDYNTYYFIIKKRISLEEKIRGLLDLSLTSAYTMDDEGNIDTEEYLWPNTHIMVIPDEVGYMYNNRLVIIAKLEKDE